MAIDIHHNSIEPNEPEENFEGISSMPTPEVDIPFDTEPASTFPPEQVDNPEINKNHTPRNHTRAIIAAIVGVGLVGGVGAGVAYANKDSHNGSTVSAGAAPKPADIVASLTPSSQTPDTTSPTSIPRMDPPAVSAPSNQKANGSASPTSAPSTEATPSASATEQAPSTAAKTAEDYRAITDLAEYYKLPPQARLLVNWSLYHHVQDDAWYYWPLSVPVDPKIAFSGFYDWNPVKNTPSPTDSGEKIMQSILFENAVVLGETTDPFATDRTPSRAIDQLGAEQTMAGLVLNPNDPATQSILDSLKNSLNSSGWESYQQAQYLSTEVLSTKEGDGGQPITSDDGLPAKWITVTNTGDPQKKVGTYKVEYVTFTDEKGATQHIWVPTSFEQSVPAS